MNVETREAYLSYSKDGGREQALREYEQFGWKYTQDVRRGRSTYQILVRDKDMPHYAEIAALDSKYFELKGKKKYYSKIVEEPLDVLLLLLEIILLVLPFVIHVTFKSLQKKRITNYNANLQVQMDECSRKAKELMNKK